MYTHPSREMFPFLPNPEAVSRGKYEFGTITSGQMYTKFPALPERSMFYIMEDGVSVPDKGINQSGCRVLVNSTYRNL